MNWASASISSPREYTSELNSTASSISFGESIFSARMTIVKLVPATTSNNWARFHRNPTQSSRVSILLPTQRLFSSAAMSSSQLNVSRSCNLENKGSSAKMPKSSRSRGEPPPAYCASSSSHLRGLRCRPRCPTHSSMPFARAPATQTGLSASLPLACATFSTYLLDRLSTVSTS